ncbi:MAG TPA: hypothetical protein VLA45_11250 [Paracoccaceae bacterium]|nr:hypothetical protein [Paracoccaceae bacterium]
MTGKDFGGPQAIRMILDRMPEGPAALQDDGLAVIAHLRDAPVAALARHLFTQAEIDAITDLMMEHFEAGGLVADTAIDHLVAHSVPE